MRCATPLLLLLVIFAMPLSAHSQRNALGLGGGPLEDAGIADSTNELSAGNTLGLLGGGSGERPSHVLKDKFGNELSDPGIEMGDPQRPVILLARCHMGSCWWWKVENTKSIQAEGSGELFRVLHRSADEEISDERFDARGYPDTPSKGAQWSKVEESFVLCSKRLPAFISYDPKIQKYLAVVPFSKKNFPIGATEGVANLYHHVCRTGGNPKFQLTAKTELMQFELRDPRDIFKAIK